MMRSLLGRFYHAQPNYQNERPHHASRVNGEGDHTTRKTTGPHDSAPSGLSAQALLAFHRESPLTPIALKSASAISRKRIPSVSASIIDWFTRTFLQGPSQSDRCPPPLVWLGGDPMWYTLGFQVVDIKHSVQKKRLYWVGIISTGRVLTTRFTKRSNKIRIIGSAEWKKFRRFYHETTKS